MTEINTYLNETSAASTTYSLSPLLVIPIRNSTGFPAGNSVNTKYIFNKELNEYFQQMLSFNQTN